MIAGKDAVKKSFGQVVKETVTPYYTGRCWGSLMVKNIFANTPLFWLMFAADFYSKVPFAHTIGLYTEKFVSWLRNARQRLTVPCNSI